MEPERVTAGELDAVAALIMDEQRRAERMVPTLGDEAAGLRAELDDLEPPWAETVRVVRGEGGDLAGAVIPEWDVAAGRAWIHGPWVAGDDDRWDRLAPRLVDAALAQLPPGVTRREMTGHVANVRLARLAGRLGWKAGAASHVLLADRAVIEGWPPPDPGLRVRPATEADLALVRDLHDTEFPATYATAAQLLDKPEQVALVAERAGGEVLGYAAGRVQPDGEGYVDFVAVVPAARGAGVGRHLVLALGRRLLALSAKEQVCLTVQDARAPARALYAGLGFRTLLSMVGYRQETDGQPPPPYKDQV